MYNNNIAAVIIIICIICAQLNYNGTETYSSLSKADLNLMSVLNF